jgi:ribosomal-protein-alanine N-acetyltransferase
MTPTLTTNRLVLRPASVDDCAELQTIFPEWDVVKYLAKIPWPYPDDGMICYTRDVIMPDVESGQLYVWTLTNKATGHCMGRIDLRPQLRPSSAEHWGYWIGLPYQQQGFMAEAANAVAEFAFDTLGLKRLTAGVVKDNIGSTRLQQSLGARNSAESMAEFTCGQREKVVWELTPDLWRTSPLKQKSA